MNNDIKVINNCNEIIDDYKEIANRAQQLTLKTQKEHQDLISSLEHIVCRMDEENKYNFEELLKDRTFLQGLRDECYSYASLCDQSWGTIYSQLGNSLDHLDAGISRTRINE